MEWREPTTARPTHLLARLRRGVAVVTVRRDSPSASLDPLAMPTRRLPKAHTRLRWRSEIARTMSSHRVMARGSDEAENDNSDAR